MKHQIIITSSGKFTTYKEESKNGFLFKTLFSPAGRSALAQAMANPIRRNLDYQGIARQILTITPMPSGALPTYNRDSGSALANKVVLPEFEIVSTPTVKLSDIKLRRFNIIDRAQYSYRRRIALR